MASKQRAKTVKVGGHEKTNDSFSAHTRGEMRRKAKSAASEDGSLSARSDRGLKSARGPKSARGEKASEAGDGSQTSRGRPRTSRESARGTVGNTRSVRSNISASGRTPVNRKERAASKYKSDSQDMPKRTGSKKVSPSDSSGASKPVLLANMKNRRTIMGSSLKRLGFTSVDGAEISGVAAQACALLDIREKDLKKLKRKFDSFDDDASGQIDISEFFKMVQEERTAFTDALFHLIDTDGSGTITFNEFVQVLVTYCIYSQSDILHFIFAYFDKDGSGAMDEQEFIDMCADINAKPHFPGNLMRAFKNFDCNDDGLIDFDEFVQINQRFPMLLFPAFRLQDQMQRVTLGSKRWTRALEHKAKVEAIEAYKLANNGDIPPWAYRTSCCGLIKGKPIVPPSN